MVIEGCGDLYVHLKCDKCEDEFKMKYSDYEDYKYRKWITNPINEPLSLICEHCKGETKIGKREQRLSQLLDKPKTSKFRKLINSIWQREK